MQEVGDPGRCEGAGGGGAPSARPPWAGGGRRGVSLRGAPWRPRCGPGGSGRGHGGSPGSPRAGAGGVAGPPRTAAKFVCGSPGLVPPPRCPGVPPPARGALPGSGAGAQRPPLLGPCCRGGEKRGTLPPAPATSPILKQVLCFQINK